MLTKEERAKMSDEEFKAYLKEQEILRTAKVADLIKYLQDNFSEDEKLCYMDCVEGVKNDCTYVTKDQIGDRFFKYVGTLKNYMIEKCNSTKEREDEMFPYVNDNDVIVI